MWWHIYFQVGFAVSTFGVFAAMLIHHDRTLTPEKLERARRTQCLENCGK